MWHTMTKKPQSRGMILIFFPIFPSNSLPFSQSSAWLFPSAPLLTPHPTPSSGSCCFRRRPDLCTVPNQICQIPVYKVFTKTATEIIFFFKKKIADFLHSTWAYYKKILISQVSSKNDKFHVVYITLCYDFNPSGFILYCWDKIQPLFCIEARPISISRHTKVYYGLKRQCIHDHISSHIEIVFSPSYSFSIPFIY